MIFISIFCWYFVSFFVEHKYFIGMRNSPVLRWIMGEREREKKFHWQMTWKIIFNSYVVPTHTYDFVFHAMIYCWNIDYWLGINFTNILWGDFLNKSVLHSFSVLTMVQFGFVSFWQKAIGAKTVCKLLERRLLIRLPSQQQEISANH